jgi:threonine aldolase
MTIADLRSDTVTHPNAAMKQAMIDAPLGDDVLGDDPTVQDLEALAAEISGKEAALFMPSGTMANQVAIRIHTRPGDEILMEQSCHPINYEAGGAAAIAGVQIRPLVGNDHMFLEVDTVASAIRSVDDHFAPATLLTIEDTTNRGGGGVYSLETLDALCELARSRGLRVHLDGARVFNAVVESQIPLARRAAGFDTLSFCLSKGLGAPVGSLLCGSTECMRDARRMRKMLGGGMRQSGMLAAAGIYALNNNIERLADDHRRAADLCSGLREAGFQVKTPPTNMVYVTLDTAPRWQDDLEAQGVRCFAVSATELRLVTHLDIDDADIAHAIATFTALKGS